MTLTQSTTMSDSSNKPQSDIRAMLADAERLKSQGDYATAASIWQQLLGLAEKELGTESPDLTFILLNLGELHRKQGDYISADNFVRRSLAIQEKALGPNHPDLATSLNNLAGLLSEQGQYASANPFYERSLEIHEKNLGPAHITTASILKRLGINYSNLGNYKEASRLLELALGIEKKILGTTHPDYATTLHSLGYAYLAQGQIGKAESMYIESLSIYDNTKDIEPLRLAVLLVKVAELHYYRGRLEQAKPLYERALELSKQVPGAENELESTILNNLGLLHAARGDYALAEDFLNRGLIALASVSKLGSLNHGNLLLNLGSLYFQMHDYEKAQDLLTRALLVQRKAAGWQHWSVAATNGALGQLHHSKKNYSESVHHYTQALEIYRQTLGAAHIDNRLFLGGLAQVFSSQGDLRLAVSKLAESLEIELNWLANELPSLPDEDRTTQLRQIGNSWEYPFGWIAAHSPATKLALETRLNRQGLLQEIEQRHAFLLNSPDIDQANVAILQSLTQQLASVTLPGDRRAALRAQRDVLESEIYRLQPDLQIQTVSIVDVANALPTDGALIEIQRYRPFDSRKSPRERWGQPQYIALVLKPNGDISNVPLGPAADIDATVHKALSASAQDQSDAAPLWAQLSDQLLTPLLPQLGGSKQWFLSPDGELNRVPFAALPAPQQPNQPLAAAVQLRVLTTGRDLVRMQNPALESQATLVVANPSFDRAGSTRAQAPGNQQGPQQRSADLGSTQWKPLPATEREGQQVAGLLGAPLLNGPAATTTALKQQQSPRVLHVATHGFFLADQDTPPTDPLQVVQERTAALAALRQEGPMLRSGLVLAGANQPAADPNDDGHLTAAEILTMNLRGTELVVLSACSTGQGEVRTGEGVYGLQRALTVAGARSTLLSLWKVDDAATAEFMIRFYKRLKAGEGRADALAAVQREFRSGSVKGSRGEDWSAPYFWAAWQLTGDWGPIPGL
jgi:CHAT domain-containing protein/Tfp pilus assembly protein PilF